MLNLMGFNSLLVKQLLPIWYIEIVCCNIKLLTTSKYLIVVRNILNIKECITLIQIKNCITVFYCKILCLYFDRKICIFETVIFMSGHSITTSDYHVITLSSKMKWHILILRCALYLFIRMTFKKNSAITFFYYLLKNKLNNVMEMFSKIISCWAFDFLIKHY